MINHLVPKPLEDPIRVVCPMRHEVLPVKLDLINIERPSLGPFTGIPHDVHIPIMQGMAKIIVNVRLLVRLPSMPNMHTHAMYIVKEIETNILYRLKELNKSENAQT